MVRVTRLNGTQFYVNADFIQTVESSPDTHIVLVNGHSYVVREPDHEVVERIIRYRQRIAEGNAGSGVDAGPQAHLRLIEAREGQG